MNSYPTFEIVDELMKWKPNHYQAWEELVPHKRQAYYREIINIINSHSWRGLPLSLGQPDAFPRVIDCQCVYWQSDPDSIPSHPEFSDSLVNLPQSLFADGIAWIMERAPLIETGALANRDAGITIMETGPLKQEWRGDVNGVREASDYPLPLPMWTFLKIYSTQWIQSGMPVSVYLGRA